MPIAETFATELLVFFNRGEFNLLLNCARQKSISPSTDPLAMQVVAAALFKLGEFSQARDYLKDLESSLSESAEYLSLYGATCRRLGLPDKAEELLAKARLINPTDPAINNNYGNLLVDLNRLEEAKVIFSGLVLANPDYADARNNLNRVNYKIKDKSDVSFDGSDPSTADNSKNESWQLADPLMMAFDENEVKQYGRLSLPSKVDGNTISVLSDDENRRIGNEKLKLAELAVSQKNYLLSLELCSQAMLTLGVIPAIYDCVADAYIGLKQFHKAEICTLQALSIAEPSFKHLINLVSFASMRSDFLLAQYYLEEAAGLDPSHVNLKKARDILNSKVSDNPNSKFNFSAEWPLI